MKDKSKKTFIHEGSLIYTKKDKDGDKEIKEIGRSSKLEVKKAASCKLQDASKNLEA